MSRMLFNRILSTLLGLKAQELHDAQIINSDLGWVAFQHDPTSFLFDDTVGEALWRLIQDRIADENDRINIEQFYRHLHFGINDCIGLDREKLRWAKRLQADGKVSIADSPSGPMVRLADDTPVKIISRKAGEQDVLISETTLFFAMPMCAALNTEQVIGPSGVRFAVVHSDYVLGIGVRSEDLPLEIIGADGVTA